MVTLQLSQQAAAVELLARRKARLGLMEFTKYTNPSYEDAPHHKIIVDKLEAVERGDIKRLMITMPPRHGKSELASRRFPAWYLGRNSDKQIIAASYNSDLASDFGREVRNIVHSPEFSALFETALAQDSKAANRWHTDKGGMYVAAGVGTAITGRGADVLLIDDPFKDRQEADSEITRNRVWDWYTSTAYTRLMPGGAVVVINCMVGDTSVLMADGSSKLLMDIRAGDFVATYDRGQLVSSAVANWINQGPDYVFSIKTTSGTIVKANERHPFLVERDGGQKWIRLRNLKVGDKLLRASTGGNGKASHVRMPIANSQLVQRGIAPPTTTKPDGQVAIDRHPLIRHRSLPRICVTDMGLAKISTQQCLCSKMESAQYALSHMYQTEHGEKNYASTIATTQEKSEDFCVTIATSWLGTEKQNPICFELLNTYAITPDVIIEISAAGREDVFDIQVVGTENFVANGLVSHNTRWHDDDLSGRLLAEQGNGGDQWELLSLPAIDDSGGALWPAWYPLERLEQIKSVLPARDWNALYQQNPIPDDGDYFKAGWFGEYDELPENLRMYGASDYAVTDGGGDFTEHGVIGVDANNNIYVMDWWRAQTTADVWIEKKCDLILKYAPHCWFGEAGPIRRSIEPFLMRRMQQREAYCRIEWMASIADKPTRARPIQAMASMGKVFLPKFAPWKHELLSQMLRFPAAKFDDGVDVMSLFGRGLEFVRGNKAKPKTTGAASAWAGEHSWMS